MKDDEMGSAYVIVAVILGLALWKCIEIFYWLINHIRINIV